MPVDIGFLKKALDDMEDDIDDIVRDIVETDLDILDDLSTHDLRQLKRDLDNMNRDMKNVGMGVRSRARLVRKTAEQIRSASGGVSTPRTITHSEHTTVIGEISNKYKHQFAYRDDKRSIYLTVHFNTPTQFCVKSDYDAYIPTDEDITNIKRRIRHYLKPKTSNSELEEKNGDELLDRMRKRVAKDKMKKYETDTIFYARTLFGGQGKPIRFHEGSKVLVSGHNLFGRKYEVEIGGKTIYTPFLESYMERCQKHGVLDYFVEKRSDDEKVILKKIMECLVTLKIAEPHHLKILELL